MTIRRIEVGQKWRHRITGRDVVVVGARPDRVGYRNAGEHVIFGMSASVFLNGFNLVEDSPPKPVSPPAQAALAGNPKDAIGSSKAPTFTVPATIQAEDGLAMFEGALKYGRHNYRAAPVRASVYVDALERHLKRWIEGEDIDPDSGLSHLTKARACLGIMRDAQICGSLIDDRPPPAPAGFFDELDKKAAALVAKHPSPVPPYVKDDSRMAKAPVEVELDALKARTQPR